MATRPDRIPLLKFLRVQEGWEAEAQKTLARAASDIARDLRKNVAQALTSGQVRQSLLEAEADLWRAMGQSIKAAQLDAAAAAAAAEVQAYDKYGILKTVGAEAEILSASLQATARSTVETAMARLNGASYVDLSTRVYRTSSLANGIVDRRVNTMLARGASARDIARVVKDLINPNVRGGVSYAAMRLGRSEINNAFHATQVLQADESPFVEKLDWNLSGSHPKPDECDTYADSSPWEIKRIPRKPHPQCFCFTTPVMVDLDTVADNFAAGKYNTWLKENGVL